ncbi:hypothetical protein V8D89_000804 [Ganoderma adspersum]
MVQVVIVFVVHVLKLIFSAVIPMDVTLCGEAWGFAIRAKAILIATKGLTTVHRVVSTCLRLSQDTPSHSLQRQWHLRHVGVMTYVCT